MPLQRLAFGAVDSPDAVAKAFRRLENLLGRTPAFGASRSVAAATTIVDSDDLVLCDTTSAGFTVTLPPAATNLGRRFTVKKTNAGALNVTLDGNGAETIDGAATVVWNGQYVSKTVQSDGVTWWLI